MNKWKSLVGVSALTLLLGACEFGVPILAQGGGTDVGGISGALVDGGGSPVSGAQIRVIPVNAPGLSKSLDMAVPKPDSTITDAVGRFTLSGLATGTYNLQAEITRGDSTLGIFIHGIVVARNTDIGIDTLRVTGSIVIETLSEAGEPLEHALCLIPGSTYEAISDIAGLCEFTAIPPGTFHIEVSHPILQATVSGNLTVLPGVQTLTNLLEIVQGGSGQPSPPGGPAQGIMASRDALIWGAAPHVGQSGSLADQNAGANNRLEAGVYDMRTVSRSLLHFDLPPGISGADIESAKLRITSYAWFVKHVRPDSVNLYVHGVLRDWKEGAGTGFAGQPNTDSIDGVTALERYWGKPWSEELVGLNDVDAEATPVAIISMPRTYTGHIDINVTALARTWANTPSENFGLLLAGDIPTSEAFIEDYPQFYSKDANVGEAYKPQLILVLTSGDTVVHDDTTRPGHALVGPTLVSPPHGATDISPYSTLIWNMVDSATAYHVQVALDTGFTSFVVNDSILSEMDFMPLDTNRFLGETGFLASYYWRVRAFNSAGASGWSEIRSFSTRHSMPQDSTGGITDTTASDSVDSPEPPHTQNTPSAPTILDAVVTSAPGSGYASVTVTWDPPADSGAAAISGIMVYGEPAGLCFTLPDNTSCTMTNLLWGQEYAVRARAINKFGAGDTSAVFLFTPEPVPSNAIESGHGD